MKGMSERQHCVGKRELEVKENQNSRIFRITCFYLQLSGMNLDPSFPESGQSPRLCTQGPVSAGRS